MIVPNLNPAQMAAARRPMSASLRTPRGGDKSFERLRSDGQATPRAKAVPEVPEGQEEPDAAPDAVEPAVDLGTDDGAFGFSLKKKKKKTAALGDEGGGAVAGDAGGTDGGAATTTERPTARDELWIPIVLIVLVALCVEWAVYQRDAIVRLRRGLSARFGRPAGGSA